MIKKELRETYMRLIKLETLQDCLELFDIFIEYLWNVIVYHVNIEVRTQANHDATVLNQMMFTKLTHLRKIIKGVDYISPNGDRLKKIIDPTIVASLIRNIFETVSLFNLIYRSTNNEDEKAIIYGLWESAGLKYRQRFESATTIPENRLKMVDEQNQIKEIEEEIKNNPLYKSLDKKNQRKIDEKLKSRDYKIRFEGTKVIYLSWHDMWNVMGLKKELFENIYTYFSLYAHPSQVSVFQFDTMFSKDEDFKFLTTVNLKFCFSLISVFVADYIHLFPFVKNTFENLEVYKQIAINAHNKMLRGDEYSINDAWKVLE